MYEDIPFSHTTSDEINKPVKDMKINVSGQRKKVKIQSFTYEKTNLPLVRKTLAICGGT